MAIPAYGDIIFVDWSPSAGREMKDPHPGVVVSATPFNRNLFCVVCPITSTVRDWPFEVRLLDPRLKTRGVVLADRPMSLDLKARRWRKVEALDAETLEELMAKLVTLFPPFSMN